MLWNGRVVFDVTYFNSRLENEIVSASTATGIPTVRNLTGTSTREGVETSVKVRPVDWLTIAGTYTYTDARDDKGVQEIRRPRHAASGTVTARSPTVTARGRTAPAPGNPPGRTRHGAALRRNYPAMRLIPYATAAAHAAKQTYAAVRPSTGVLHREAVEIVLPHLEPRHEARAAVPHVPVPRDLDCIYLAGDRIEERQLLDAGPEVGGRDGARLARIPGLGKMHHQVGLAERAQRLERHKLRIAGPDHELV